MPMESQKSRRERVHAPGGVRDPHGVLGSMMVHERLPHGVRQGDGRAFGGGHLVQIVGDKITADAVVIVVHRREAGHVAGRRDASAEERSFEPAGRGDGHSSLVR
ncbi:hypothetical protein Apa02nite_087340 [Actinoplanes palleronii]|uniref:Uncharacterized protein n=1 Tax=Actinoplanes palleronii TaxID=113570 RepID=A0ABQ4BQP1_9ACTN|nr:hypothetical protein Apa02nite_087340 [Actinoplanes palleronii]